MQTLPDQLQERLVTALDYVGETVKKGVDLAGEQMPLVAQDVVRWGIWTNVMWLLG